MFCVVLLHNLGQGGILSLEFNSPSDFPIALLEDIAIVGVNLFALISGYLSSGNRSPYSKGLSLWVEAIAWSFLSTLFFSTSAGDLSFSVISGSLFPVLTGRYWYLNAYLALLILTPLVAKGLANMSTDSIRKLATTVLILAMGSYFARGGLGMVNGYSTFWLLTLYILGFAIRNDSLLKFHVLSSRLLGIVSVGCVITTLLGQIVVGPDLATQFLHYNSPMVIIQSLCWFELLMRMKISPSHKLAVYLSLASRSSFAVYLIDQSDYFYDVVLKNSLAWIGDLPLWLAPTTAFLVSFCMFAGFLLIACIAKLAVERCAHRFCTSF